MAAFSGTAGSVSLGAVAISLVSEWNFDLSMSPVESTDFGKNSDRYVPSVRTASGNITANLSEARTDTGATFIQNEFLSGTTPYILHLYDTVGGDEWTLANVKFTGFQPTISVKGKAELSIDFVGEVSAYVNP